MTVVYNRLEMLKLVTLVMFLVYSFSRLKILID